MMKRGLRLAAVFGLSLTLFVAGIEAAQRGWILPLKASAGSTPGARSKTLIARPQAAIGGDANGVYCVHPSDNGVGIHDIGALPAGLHVVVTVESYSDGFNPVAAVVVPTLGEKAANTIKVATFYDNDSGGESDAKIDFVTPQAGNYVLFVGDFTDATTGCYRYQLLIG